MNHSKVPYGPSNIFGLDPFLMRFTSINPSTGTVIERYDALEDKAIEERIARAAAAYRLYHTCSFEERILKLNGAAKFLEESAETCAKLITIEMGKPISQARAEIKKCAWVCRFYAEQGEDFLQEEVVASEAGKSYVTYQPMGPLLGVMPWNFPFWQVFRFAAPVLMAGNVCLIKHAPNVTGCALKVETILREAGFDQNEFQVLPVPVDKVASIIEDKRVKGVSLTGSDRAGSSVASAAGRNIKPTLLELGGSDPFIVLADANVEHAASIGLRSRMQNAGQSCIAAKRFILEKQIAEEFLAYFLEGVEALKVGNPMEASTDMGPIAREDLRNNAHEQVKRSLIEGAQLKTGGKKLEGPGFFYAPTVLTDIKPNSVAFEEELFGPIAALVFAEDADHSVELANASPFGLGGAVFTEDVEKGEQIARQLEVGCAFINEMVKSDPRLPFGGIKHSGYGRELSQHGIRAFVNAKTVWVK